MRYINYLKMRNRVQTLPPIISPPCQNQDQLINSANLHNSNPNDNKNLPQVNNLTGGNISNLHPPSNYVWTENQQDSGWSDLSNRRVLLLGAVQVGLIFLPREGVYGTTFLCNMYTRLINYTLSVVWVTNKPKVRAYALAEIAKWKSKFINEDL